MRTRRIGSLEVSVVGIGCNNFGWRVDEPRTRDIVHAALDAGINFLDTADTYGRTQSEVLIGRALGARRREVVLATKFGHRVDEERRGAHPAYVRRAVEDSLRRLGTDYIDLYQLHFPDPTVPIADTLGALDELVRAGKVREIGCSNFDVALLQEAEGAAPPGAARFVSVQNEYNLLFREPERGVLDACARGGTAFLPFYPLASGLLTGKVRVGHAPPPGTRLAEYGQRYEYMTTPENLRRVEALIAFAEARGHTLLELAFSWLLARPVVASVIAGVTSPAQVHANAAAPRWELSPGDLAAIDALLEGA